MSKFLKLEIAKRSVTDVYIEVPDDFDIKGRIPPELVKQATMETTHPADWDDFGAENELEVEGRSFVKEKEARQFTLFELERTAKVLGIKIVDKPKSEAVDPNQLELVVFKVGDRVKLAPNLAAQVPGGSMFEGTVVEGVVIVDMPRPQIVYVAWDHSPANKTPHPVTALVKMPSVLDDDDASESDISPDMGAKG